MNIKRSSVIVAASLLLPLSGAWAQSDYPNHAIKIIAPVATGSGADTLIRRIGEHVSKTLGQPVVIENKPGAQGAIAARLVAKAPNDGYTLLVAGNSSHSANVHMINDLGYDPVKDFTPIARLTTNPQLFVINSELPVKTVQEFVKYAKERPGKLSYGTGNSGSVVASQLLKTQAGIQAVGVNYPGMAQAATDLLGGRVEFIMLDPVIAKSHVDAGKLRILAITSRQRLSSFPDVVPMAEAGLPGYDYAGWIGVVGPAGMPAQATKRLNDAFLKALADPAIDSFLASSGMIPAGSTPEQMRTFMQEQITLWGRWVKEAGLTPL